MAFITGNPYKIAAIQKAKRLKEEKEAAQKWNALSRDEQDAKTKESELKSFTSQRKDMNAMLKQYHW